MQFQQKTDKKQTFYESEHTRDKALTQPACTVFDLHRMSNKYKEISTTVITIQLAVCVAYSLWGTFW